MLREPTRAEGPEGLRDEAAPSLGMVAVHFFLKRAARVVNVHFFLKRAARVVSGSFFLKRAARVVSGSFFLMHAARVVDVHFSKALRAWLMLIFSRAILTVCE